MMAFAQFIGAQEVIAKDTTSNIRPVVAVDSLPVASESDIKSPIKYSAKDSMMFSVKTKMIYAYGGAQLGMEEMHLNAGFVKMHMDSNFIYAEAYKNKEGELVEPPVFKQGNEEYRIKTIKYNFKSQKGIVTDVITQQAGGILHSKTTKMHPNKEIHIADGKFTTCDADHPHFYLRLTKAKVIPEEKIVTGPFHFVISDIPLPIGLPFGYFPNSETRTAGIIIPKFTEERRRGFGLEQLGYYQPINDFVDLTAFAEIWSGGSWGIDLSSNYKKRYRYSGSFFISYKEVIDSEKGLPDYSKSNNFWVKLNYNRDSKASPTSTFGASLNFGSSKFRQYESSDPRVNANNSTSSNITYSKTFPNFSLSANISGTQNLTTGLLSLELPSLTFNMTKRLKPFQKKVPSGKKRWYEETQIGFSSSMRNSLNIKDSLLFTKKALENMSNGINYTIPISTNIKLFKYLNLSPSINYSGKIYTKQLVQVPDTAIVNGEIINLKEFRTDTVSRLGHVYDFSFSTPLSTTIYGLIQFEKGPIAAIRHVMSPSIAFSYKPDFGQSLWGFYEKDKNDSTNQKLFSKYYGIFGTAPTGKSGTISFGLGNNLEMKTHSKDTTEKYKKIMLLQSLNIGTSYNMAADSIRWSNVSISAGTRLLKQISVNYSGAIDLYMRDKNGITINKMYLKEKKKLGHYTQHSISLSGSIDSETFKKKKTEPSNQSKNQDPLSDFDDNLRPTGSNTTDKQKAKQETKTDADGYDFNIPWNVSVNYTFNNNRNTFNPKTQSFDITNNQSASLSGNLSLTKKWKINGSVYFDLEAGKVANTNWGINRDLHCWEMSFNFTPFGAYQSYSFRIAVKSSLLQGLEYKKQSSWRDNFAF
jgi:lipopolysaccharide assembly outer membrane protein LptD (OstA)